VQSLRRSPDMSLFQNDLEKNEEIEIDAREISFIQHIAEVIAFDSMCCQ
jgi:hypothetical protein